MEIYKWFANDSSWFLITFTSNKTPAENFCLDVGRSTTRGHDTQAAAAALHVFPIKLHVLEENEIFWGRRKDLEISIRIFVGHVCFNQIQHIEWFYYHWRKFTCGTLKINPNHQFPSSKPSLLMENGLVQDRNRLVSWATQAPRVMRVDGKRAPSKRRNSHGNWKIYGCCFPFGNTSSKLSMFQPCWFTGV